MSSPPGTRSPLSLPLAAAEPDRRRTWRVAAGCGVGGGLVLAAYAVVFGIIGAATTWRRDLT